MKLSLRRKRALESYIIDGNFKKREGQNMNHELCQERLTLTIRDYSLKNLSVVNLAIEPLLVALNSAKPHFSSFFLWF